MATIETAEVKSVDLEKVLSGMEKAEAVKLLKELGGREWQKDAMHRVYFEFPSRFYETVNSNGETYLIAGRLLGAKVFYDLVKKRFEYKQPLCRRGETPEAQVAMRCMIEAFGKDPRVAVTMAARTQRSTESEAAPTVERLRA